MPVSSLRSLQEIDLIESKLSAFQGPDSCKKRLELALKKEINAWCTAYTKTSDSNTDFRKVVQLRVRALQIEEKLGFRSDAAQTLHCLASTCFQWSGACPNQPHYKEGWRWAAQAFETDPSNVHHFKYLQTCYKNYLFYLENQLLQVDQGSEEWCTIWHEAHVLVLEAEKFKVYNASIDFCRHADRYIIMLSEYINKRIDQDKTDAIHKVLKRAEEILELLQQIELRTSNVSVNQLQRIKERDVNQHKFLSGVFSRLINLYRTNPPRTRSELESFANGASKIFEILERMHNFQDASFISAQVSNICRLAILRCPELKIYEFTKVMYDYAVKALNCSNDFQHFYIADIFQIYADTIAKSDPHQAIEISLQALDYSSQKLNDCRVPFFCMKTIAACHLQLSYAENTELHLSEALKYSSDAVTYHRNHNLRDLDLSDQYHLMSTLHYHLGQYFDNLGNPQAAEFQYRESIHWAKIEQNIRKIAKGQQQLATILFAKGDYEGAIGHWREAIKLFLNDLYQRAEGSQQFQELIYAIEKNYYTNEAQCASHAYKDLALYTCQKLIAIGHELLLLS